MPVKGLGQTWGYLMPSSKQAVIKRIHLSYA